MWKWYALLSALFAALTALFSKSGVKGLDPDLATAIRVTFILVLVWGIVLVKGSLKDARDLPLSDIGFLFLSAMATGFSWLFYFKALEQGDVSKVAPLDKLSVPLVIILSILFLGEAWSWKVIIGGGLITLGSLVLLL